MVHLVASRCCVEALSETPINAVFKLGFGQLANHSFPWQPVQLRSIACRLDLHALLRLVWNDFVLLLLQHNLRSDCRQHGREDRRFAGAEFVKPAHELL
jgi:hypothetical protein